MNHITLQHILACCFVASLSVLSSSAQSVPSLINYQGRLVDSADSPLPPGNYGVAFRLWDKQSLDADQQLIWGREYDVTIAEGGVFGVILGSGGRSLSDDPPPAVNNLAFAFTAATRFLGIAITRTADGQSVQSPSEILPRQQILSTPFAFKAQVATEVVPAMADVLSPVGAIVAFGGTPVPSGWLLCDGQAVSRTDFSNLFSRIGIAFGPGDGVSTFNLPDLRGRVGIGAGQGIGLSSRSLGHTLGAETHTLSIAEMPSHTHQITVGGGSSGPRTAISVDTSPNASYGNQPQHTGGGQPHNNVQPSLVLHYIIKH